MEDRLVALAAQIVAAHASNNVVPHHELPALIRDVQQTLFSLGHIPSIRPPGVPELSVPYAPVYLKSAGWPEGETTTTGMAKLDVQTVAMECLDIIRPVSEMKGLTLSIACAPGTQRELRADPVALKQVLLALLGNAVKFTVQGAVELRLRPVMDGSTLRIEVTDTGPGISAQQRRILLRHINRHDYTAMRVVPEMGRRLTLSALVHQMGGRLGHNNNPGGGSVFWVEFKLNTIDGPLPAMGWVPEISTAVTVSSPRSSLHVLVVEDNRMNRDLIMAILIRAGHKVTCVGSGPEAITEVKKEHFDVVLMDIRMPGMDGAEATRCIRSLEGAQGLVPILAVTAQDYPEYVERCRRAGMDGHIAKPFDPVRLNAIIWQAAVSSQSHGEKLAWLGSERVAEV